MTHLPFFSIVIVNYNAGPWLRTTVRAVLAYEETDFELLIIDNASTDHSLDALPSDPRLHIIRLEENTGFAKANNIGAGHAKAPWLITLNPDTLPAKNWLTHIRNAIMHYPDTQCFGCTQIAWEHDATQAESLLTLSLETLQHTHPNLLLDGTGDAYNLCGIPYRKKHLHPLASFDPTKETPLLMPCAAAGIYRKEAFVDVGGFCEEFFCYCEDVDLGLRLRLRGYHARYIASAWLFHVGSVTTGKKSDFTLFHSARNRWWVLLRIMPGWLFLLALPLHVLCQLCLLYFSYRRGQHALMLKAWKAAWQPSLLRWLWQSRTKIQATRRITCWQFWQLLSPLWHMQKRQ